MSAKEIIAILQETPRTFTIMYTSLRKTQNTGSTYTVIYRVTYIYCWVLSSHLLKIVMCNTLFLLHDTIHFFVSHSYTSSTYHTLHVSTLTLPTLAIRVPLFHVLPVHMYHCTELWVQILHHSHNLVFIETSLLQ